MEPIGVLVIDDSVVIRRVLSNVLDADPGIQVLGTAANGQLGLDKIATLHPDVVILDVEMPVMDGLSTLRALRPTYPLLPVIMFSTLTEYGAAATLEALAAGASDYVTKPSKSGSIEASVNSIRDELVPKIKALFKADREHVAPTVVKPVTRIAAPRRQSRVEILAIGCSTGGPEALNTIVAQLPAGLPVPVVVTQHMPALFTRLFAERLNRTSALMVAEAIDGQPLVAGQILIAPGGQHLTVIRRGAGVHVKLTSEPPENFCRPAVDVMFRSVAAVYGAGSLACVLTGMGHDGAAACELIAAAGGRIVVQDQATSVVWGMPGAVAAAGLADDVVPIGSIAGLLVAAIGSGARRDGAPARPDPPKAFSMPARATTQIGTGTR